MFIEIDSTTSRPIFDQVAQQLKFAIAAGTIRTEEMIPSVRDLARRLAVNPTTIVRAYRILQDEGILVSQRGVGLVVAKNAQDECKKQRKGFFQKRFQSFLEAADRSGLTRKELEEILTKH